jgi:predicted hydrolase (HD superfamily)
MCESESLRKHMLYVEAAMRAYAKKYGQDQALWGAAGLLHYFDYEKFPHPYPVAKTGYLFEDVKYLESQGYPNELSFKVSIWVGEFPRLQATTSSIMGV